MTRCGMMQSLCVSGTVVAIALAHSVGAAAAPTNAECDRRVNDTTAKLVECIQEPQLFKHLTALQRIADENPDLAGHGNRDTGKPGYRASVDYVADLMAHAGYKVTIQPYTFTDFALTGAPRLSVNDRDFAVGRDWYVARMSGQGSPTAPVQPIGPLVRDTASESRAGCSKTEFGSSVRGAIALIERGGCSLDVKVANAQAAGAVGVILFNLPADPNEEPVRGADPAGGAVPARLEAPARVPVVGVASYALGEELYGLYSAGHAPIAHLEVQSRIQIGAIDYNLIADSPFGDTTHVVVVDAHLDAIYGAGILDNGSGSATILEVALKLARTPTLNHLRFIWFGGEELGLLGSKYYTRTLSSVELKRIVFDVDADVTATPNYAILIADPQHASNVRDFPPNVVSQSHAGANYLLKYFKLQNLPIRNAHAGNDGTDSNSFSLVGVPNSGIFTQQDCCKQPSEVSIWGGFLGNFEGDIPSHDGGCVDQPHKWCDNLQNVAPYVHEFISKGFAYATLKLANDAAIDDYAR